MSRAVRAGIVLVVAASLGAAGWYWYARNDPERLFRRGLGALDRGNLDEAERLADVLEESAPARAGLLRGKVFFLRGRALQRLGEGDRSPSLFRQALDELERVGQDDPLHPDAALVAGQCLFHLRLLAPAESVLLYATEERPDDADAHRALAALYYDQEALALTVHHLREVARLDPLDGRPHLMLASIHKDMEKFPEAAEHYREALRRYLPGPKVDEARIGLAEVLVRRDKPREALELLDQLGASGREEELPSALRGECLAAGAGDPARLGAFLDAALRQHPRSPRLLRLRGQLFIDLGEAGRGVPYFEKAAANAPDEPSYRYQLGQLYRRLGRTADAEKQDLLAEETRKLRGKLTELTQKAAAEPWDASVRREMAEVHTRLGHKELAEMCRRAADACPPAPAPARKD